MHPYLPSNLFDKSFDGVVRLAAMTKKFKKVDHVAIAVPNLEAAISLYKGILGKDPEHIEEVAEQKVQAAFFGVGETNLELLFPTSPDSPISNFLAKNNGRGGLHHICLEVENIEERLSELKKNGIVLIDEKPRMGAHGKRIAFVHPKSTGGVLIELSEMVIPAKAGIQS